MKSLEDRIANRLGRSMTPAERDFTLRRVLNNDSEVVLYIADQHSVPEQVAPSATLYRARKLLHRFERAAPAQREAAFTILHTIVEPVSE